MKNVFACVMFLLGGLLLLFSAFLPLDGERKPAVCDSCLCKSALFSKKEKSAIIFLYSYPLQSESKEDGI
jgi:hypothetical protein